MGGRNFDCQQGGRLSAVLLPPSKSGRAGQSTFELVLDSLPQIDVVGTFPCDTTVRQWLFSGASVYVCEMLYSLLSNCVAER